MPPDLDALLTHLYVRLDDSLPVRAGPGRRPRINDAEIICLSVAQALLNIPSDRVFLRRAALRLGHLFPDMPGQSGYLKRVRALGDVIATLIGLVASDSNALSDDVWLVDSTPIPCASSRQTTRRSDLAGYASYGWSASHSRYFWGFRLHLICDLDGMPIRYALTAAACPERDTAEALLDPILRPGQTVIADKGYAGHDHEAFYSDHHATLLRPDRRNERRRLGSLGFVRQRIESVFDTAKDQLGLERHGARTLTSLHARIAQRLLALAVAIWHNRNSGHYPRRDLVSYAA